MYLLDLGTLMDGDVSRGGSSSSWQSAVGVKYLDRPKEFHNEEARWKDWMFNFSNWMSLLEVRFSTLLDAAEQADSEVPNQGPEDMQRLQHVLFSVLASVLTGKSLRILQAVKGSRLGDRSVPSLRRELSRGDLRC